MKQKIYMSFLEPKFGLIITFVLNVFSELSVLPVKKKSKFDPYRQKMIYIKREKIMHVIK